MPEVATSIVAAIRGERDIAVGNVVGSNIFNLLAVLGLTGLVAPDGVPVAAAALAFDLPVMIAVALACLPIFFTGFRVARWEGWLFLVYYAAYVLYLILDASQHDALPLFSSVMLLFVVPLTALTLLVLVVRERRGTSPDRGWQHAAVDLLPGVQTQPMNTILMLVAGLVLLVVGAEALVRGASKIAAAFGISPLVIGLTVVAFGTSAPEMAVGAQAALTGNADIALGNVIGSNIFNILVIIGLSAVIIPLVVHQQLVRWEVPLVIGLSILVLIMGLDGKLGRIEGTLLFLGLITYHRLPDLEGPQRVGRSAAGVCPGIRQWPRPRALASGR